MAPDRGHSCPQQRTTTSQARLAPARPSVPDGICCEVQDEGPGLSVEDQKRLFSKFARLSAKPTAGEPSVGLGLSIVKRMVEEMHGRVWCESDLGPGAKFIVSLPTAK